MGDKQEDASVDSDMSISDNCVISRLEMEQKAGEMSYFKLLELEVPAGQQGRSLAESWKYY